MLLRKHRKLPALMCAQNSAAKIIPTENDFINSNIAGFGNAIGSITNRITSMYEVQSKFEEDSDEYKILDYRICCGQLQQQDAIDKIKGVVSKPMPREWYDPFYVRKIEDEDTKQLYENIIADRKPYFMRYIYQQISHEYRLYERKSNLNHLIRYGTALPSGVSQCDSNHLDTDEFAENFTLCAPLGMGDCVMNKICWIFENSFDGKYAALHKPNVEFDYTLLKSGVECDKDNIAALKRLYKQYNARVKTYNSNRNYENIDQTDASEALHSIKEEFIEECYKFCTNKYELCDIILDITYCSKSSKSFAWSICGDVIIENLFNRFGHVLSFPTLDENGDIYFCGNRYSVKTVNIKEVSIEV